MPASIQQLKAKAEGTLDALKAMSAKERERLPTAEFAEDFNKFRRLALEAKPEIAEVAPAEIEIFESISMDMVPKARYVEIQAYYSQVLRML